MDNTGAARLAELPDDMFSIIKDAGSKLGPRLGRLSLPGRRTIETPHYLGITSRGVVPHITQDTFQEDTDISGVYVPLEDCKSCPTIRACNGVLTNLLTA